MDNEASPVQKEGVIKNSETPGKGNDNIILEVHEVSRHFGGIKALSDVTLAINKESIISIIGPNGAGKSTFINAVTGIFPPDTGKILFNDKDISRVHAHKIAGLGIARTFQFVELFPSLSVLENAMMGYHTGSRAGMFSAGLKLPRVHKEEKNIRDGAIENLKLVGLEHRINDCSISCLPLGERKLLGIARSLCLNPAILMLDEPAAGLAAHEVNRLACFIHELSRRGLTIIIIEHNMPFVMSISERVIVLNQGKKIADGLPDEIKSDEAVKKAYLGEETPGWNNCRIMDIKKEKRQDCRLEIKKVSAYYGEAQALHEVSLKVNAGEIVALLGSNRAGKSTLLKILAGILPLNHGDILFGGESIKGMGPHDIIKKGISSVPEERELFGTMNVSDNLLLGSYSMSGRERKRCFSSRLEKVFDIFPALKNKLGQKARTLSGGEQQMLAVARALIPNPGLLALDEPSLGLSPLLITEMMDALKQISIEQGVVMLLVEQNVKAALKIADYVYVLERGRIVLEGCREEIMANPNFFTAYLGC